MLICSSHKAGYLGRARAQPSRLLDCKEQLIASTLKMRRSEVGQGAGNGRADKPATVRQPPSIACGRKAISPGRRGRPRPVAIRCSGPGVQSGVRDEVWRLASQIGRIC